MDRSGDRIGEGPGGETQPKAADPVAGEERITLGGGCFWCLEAVYLDVAGVTTVVSGYAGGHVPNPGYEAVCTGNTGHAEVVQVSFDSSRIGLGDILRIFFTIHDPTTPGRQGHDVGPQYRSMIQYHNDAQADFVRRYIDDLTRRQVFADPIVTEVLPLTLYAPAEAEHQRYFENHPSMAYCTTVVARKLSQFRRGLAELRRK